MPLSDDDLDKIAARVNRVLGDYDSKGQPQDKYKDDPVLADNRIRSISNRVDKILNKLNAK